MCLTCLSTDGGDQAKKRGSFSLILQRFFCLSSNSYVHLLHKQVVIVMLFEWIICEISVPNITVGPGY